MLARKRGNARRAAGNLLSSDTENVGQEVLDSYTTHSIPQTAISVDLDRVAVGGYRDRGSFTCSTLTGSSTGWLVLIGIGGGRHVSTRDCQDACSISFIVALTHISSAIEGGS